jgi:hypothetical protein
MGSHRSAAAATPPPPALEWGPSTASSSWREGAITRIHELDALHAWLSTQPVPAAGNGIDAAIRNHLRTAHRAAMEDHHPWRLVSGAIHERINSNCDAAEALLLRIAPADYIVGQIPRLVAHVQRHLVRPTAAASGSSTSPIGWTGSGPPAASAHLWTVPNARSSSRRCERPASRPGASTPRCAAFATFSR